MTTTIEYAALAAFVYNDQRGGGSENPTNKLILPDNWQDMSKLGFAVGDSLNAINPFSFTGGAYLNQATGEIGNWGSDTVLKVKRASQEMGIEHHAGLQHAIDDANQLVHGRADHRLGW